MLGEVRVGAGAELVVRGGAGQIVVETLRGDLGGGGGGCGVCVGVGVVDGCYRVGLVGEGADEGRAHEVGGAGVGFSCDEDVGALADSERDGADGVRLDGDEVVGDYCHVVAVNAELLSPFRTRVYEAEPMDFVCLEFEFGDASIGSARLSVSNFATVIVHFSVDKVVV